MDELDLIDFCDAVVSQSDMDTMVVASGSTSVSVLDADLLCFSFFFQAINVAASFRCRLLPLVLLTTGVVIIASLAIWYFSFEVIVNSALDDEDEDDGAFWWSLVHGIGSVEVISEPAFLRLTFPTSLLLWLL